MKLAKLAGLNNACSGLGTEIFREIDLEGLVAKTAGRSVLIFFHIIFKLFKQFITILNPHKSPTNHIFQHPHSHLYITYIFFPYAGERSSSSLLYISAISFRSITPIHHQLQVLRCRLNDRPRR